MSLLNEFEKSVPNPTDGSRSMGEIAIDLIERGHFTTSIPYNESEDFDDEEESRFFSEYSKNNTEALWER